MQVVPTDEPELEQLGWEFEGLAVQHSKLEPASPGEFPCMDEEGQPLMLKEGDIVVYQAEAIVTSVEIGAGYKGGIQVKARKRTHHAKTIDGSQVVVGVQSRR